MSDYATKKSLYNHVVGIMPPKRCIEPMGEEIKTEKWASTKASPGSSQQPQARGRERATLWAWQVGDFFWLIEPRFQPKMVKCIHFFLSHIQNFLFFFLLLNLFFFFTKWIMQNFNAHMLPHSNYATDIIMLDQAILHLHEDHARVLFQNW